MPSWLSTAFLAAPAVLRASAGQFPVVDGVIGGVATQNDFVPQTANVNSAFEGEIRVVENSGICETTEGVYQASGYGDIAEDESVWFWYFASRNDPENAPLTLWFNGGPGSSSEIGLFQELGPCKITNDSSSVTVNPWSWNTNSNLLFIDQPIGVGFSHGNTHVGSSHEAAADVWTFLQLFLSDPKFEGLRENELAIWTESYGGHYGPAFASYILDQNEGIAAGTVDGFPLNLKYLGVGDGLTDPVNQYPGYITYAANNPYHPLVDDSTIARAQTYWEQEGGCRDQIIACNDGGSDSVCSRAQSNCNSRILSPLAGPYDVYFVLAENPDPYPADFSSYLASIQDQIGAEKTWEQTNLDVYSNFAATGDWMRTSVPDLEKVIDSGVRTLVYCGDADYILNYPGIEDMIGNFSTKFSDEYAQQEWSDFTVNGTSSGQYKNAGTFSYVRIYGAGHEVPAYTHGGLEYGEAAFQMFDQIMSNKTLSGT